MSNNTKSLNDQHTGSCIRTIVGNYSGFAKMPYLVGKDQENCEITCINKLEFEFNETKTKAYIEIERISDAIFIDAICFKFNELNKIAEFLDQLKKQNLHLKIKSDQTNLQYLHFGVLTELNDPFIDENNITVTIDILNKYLLNRIYLLALKNEKIHVEIDFEPVINLISITDLNISLYVKCLYYETEIRRQIGNQITSSYIQHLNGGLLNMSKSEPYSVTDDDLTYKFKLLTDNYTKGFIIYSNNIDKIKYFTLQLYDLNMIDYDKYCLHKYCTRISNNLLYIPTNTLIKEPFSDISEFNEFIQTDKVFHNNKTISDFDNCFGLNLTTIIGHKFCNKTKLEQYNGAVDLERMDFKCISITFEKTKQTIPTEQTTLTEQSPTLGIYTIGLNHMFYFGSEGKLKLCKTNDFNVVCHKTKETIYESLMPILSESDIKKINKSIGFWRYIWNDTDIGIKTNYLWTEIPIENSALDKETQSLYINKLIELENSNKVNVDTYLGKHRCRICNDYVGCKEYTFNGFVWPESYIHYIRDHNVRIDNKMTKLLDSINNQHIQHT
jgi:hypothetical protein